MTTIKTDADLRDALIAHVTAYGWPSRDRATDYLANVVRCFCPAPAFDVDVLADAIARKHYPHGAQCSIDGLCDTVRAVALEMLKGGGRCKDCGGPILHTWCLEVAAKQRALGMPEHAPVRCVDCLWTRICRMAGREPCCR